MRFAQVVVCGGLGSAAIADSLIAGLLTFYLRRGREDLHAYGHIHVYVWDFG